MVLTSAKGAQVRGWSSSPAVYISGLAAGTVYEVAAAVVLGSGVSMPALDRPSFSTPAGPDAPVITALTALNSTTAQISIDPPFTSPSPRPTWSS